MTAEFTEHNRSVTELMEAFRGGAAPRVPASIRTPTRFFVFSKEINRKGYTFVDYYNNPDVMWELQLQGRKWARLNLVGDQIMGLPEERWAGVTVDFHGGLEESYLGNEVALFEDQVMDSHPFLRDDKQTLKDKEPPDPFQSGWMARQLEFYEYFEDKRQTEDFEGLPVGPTGVSLGSDGPFTVAQKLRGTEEFCLDVAADPDFVHRLMTYVTDATIRRIEAWADRVGWEYPTQSWGMADDSICLLSEAAYREFVLPYHKRLYGHFSTGGPNSIHCCGAAHHLHKVLVDELNIQRFDCGYITDVPFARKQVGTEVTYQWRFNPRLLLGGSPHATIRAVREMFDSGACEGRRTMIQEVAYAGLRVDRWNEMYEAIKEICIY